ncbi:MAG: tRNA lysidine(34) synthetase TilS [Planctomycetaceae bacterium]|jgi:tRNA(Ile)-lysidine synthase|nr:tRNA lysidine(34) synthetase TilS [Planctomycetaceae bacterium]
MLDIFSTISLHYYFILSMIFSDQWFLYGLFLAVSGGADSSAMLHGAVRYARLRGLPVPVVGHVNHGLRGEESDGDEIFVSSLADEYGLKFFSHRITGEEWSLDETGSVEAAAREIRYKFLSSAAVKCGCRYIATAHTADDQVETVLHRLLRGTGISGLCGITFERQFNYAVSIVRPLLGLRRADVIRYLESINKNYRFDSSNAGVDFTRNKIRNELLPTLRKDFNSGVDDAILRLSSIADGVNDIISDWYELQSNEIIISATKNKIVLNRTKLIQLKAGMICEFFRRLWGRQGWSLRYMGYERWNELTKFALEGVGSMSLTGSITAEILNKDDSRRDNKFQANRLSESNQQSDYLIIKNNSQDALSACES